MNNPNQEKLIKTLLLLAQFPTDVNMVANAKDFMVMYNRCLSELQDIANRRNSAFIKNMLTQYPQFSEGEIDQFIAEQRGDKSLLSLSLGNFTAKIIELFKSNGYSHRETTERLVTVSTLNIKMSKIVEDSVYEQLYQQTSE